MQGRNKMTENLNRSPENEYDALSNHDQPETDTPEFDKDAARRARIEAYREAHPDAVEDVEKARAMAEAGDPYETAAVKNLEVAKKNMREQGSIRYQDGDFVYLGDTEGRIAITENGTALEYLDENRKFHTEYFPKNETPFDIAKVMLSTAKNREEVAGEKYDANQEVQNLKIDDLRKGMKKDEK